MSGEGPGAPCVSDLDTIMYTNTIVSTEDLARHLDDPSWIIFDCRFTLTDPDGGRLAYAQGHIPGARYTHLDEDLAGEVIPGVTGRHQRLELQAAGGGDRGRGVRTGRVCPPRHLRFRGESLIGADILALWDPPLPPP